MMSPILPLEATRLASTNAAGQRHCENGKAGIAYYRPWVFLITDGVPTDSWQNAARLVREGEQSSAFSFFPVGVEGADFATLAQPSTREPLRLQGVKFRELFKWLSSSLKSVSQTNPGDKVQLASPSGWAEV